MRRAPRIGLLGLFVESNRFAPAANAQDLADGLFQGAALLREARSVAPSVPAELPAFCRRMDETTRWEPIPVALCYSDATGPVDDAFFDAFIGDLRRRLAAEAPMDGVYLCTHGAALTTEQDDPDGILFAMVRGLLGSSVPMVTTVDLHANISRDMVDNVDALIGYRTNPHLDAVERGEEAADVLQELLGGVTMHTGFIRLPLVVPQVAQRTQAGQPLGDLIQYGQAQQGTATVNVSICSGCSFSDTADNGMSIVVTTRGEPKEAQAIATRIAEKCWADRLRFVPGVTSIERAVELAVSVGRDPDLSPIILADVGDNPGGGGRGNVTALLSRLVDAGAGGVQLGLFFDPELVADAVVWGEGASFLATFARSDPAFGTRPYETAVRVVRLTRDGTLVGRRGVGAGQRVDLGPSCLLSAEGVQVAVSSKRVQCLEPAYLERVGCDVSAARCLVLKSRGHFRAGFADFTADENIFEVNTPGLTSADLAHFPWSRLPRPVFPLDPETIWEPSVA